MHCIIFYVISCWSFNILPGGLQLKISPWPILAHLHFTMFINVHCPLLINKLTEEGKYMTVSRRQCANDTESHHFAAAVTLMQY